MRRIIVVVMLFMVSASAKESVLFFTYDKNSFSATGNWTPADQKEKASFLSETQIDCSRTGKSCVEATAEFYMGHPHVTLNYLQIIKWDNDGIIATDSSGICMAVTMQISFAEKHISSTHSMKQLDDEKKQACSFFGAEKVQEDVFVVKGSARWNKEHSFLPDKSEK